MDTESLKSLGSLLLWGGLFFVLMRYSCGAHMMGGHGAHGGHGGRKGAEPEGEVKDPVCGMAVDPKNAAAAAVRGGTTHYFCSSSCRDKFEQAPEKYTEASTARENQHGGHRHG